MFLYVSDKYFTGRKLVLKYINLSKISFNTQKIIPLKFVAEYVPNEYCFRVSSLVSCELWRFLSAKSKKKEEKTFCFLYSDYRLTMRVRQSHFQAEAMFKMTITINNRPILYWNVLAYFIKYNDKWVRSKRRNAFRSLNNIWILRKTFLVRLVKNFSF